jgi:hypothetical protein
VESTMIPDAESLVNVSGGMNEISVKGSNTPVPRKSIVKENLGKRRSVPSLMIETDILGKEIEGPDALLSPSVSINSLDKRSRTFSDDSHPMTPDTSAKPRKMSTFGGSNTLEHGLHRRGSSDINTSKFTLNSFLKSLPIFHSLSEAQSGKLCQVGICIHHRTLFVDNPNFFYFHGKVVKRVKFDPDELITKQGNEGSVMYIIEEGHVTVYKKGPLTSVPGTAVFNSSLDAYEEDSEYGAVVGEIN